MSVAFVIPKEYGYVVAVTSATFFVGFWHGMRGSMFRRAAKVPYPKPYADSGDYSAADAETKKAQYLWNCAQRAHGNYLEAQPAVALSLLISGVQYPTTAATLGAIWTLGRIIYAIGYTSPNAEKGKGRVYGFMIALLPQLGLWGLAAYSGIKLVL